MSLQSFQQVPALWQYVILGLAGLVLGYAIVAVHNKLMEGRKWCIKIAQGCTNAGLTDLATFFTELGTGDLIDAEKQALKWAAEMNDPTKRMALLAQAVEDSVQYVAANDLGVATKILAILQNGAASKSLFAAAAKTDDRPEHVTSDLGCEPRNDAMTRNESTTIEKLRDELHAYHVDVQKLVQRCEACRADVVQIDDRHLRAARQQRGQSRPDGRRGRTEAKPKADACWRCGGPGCC